MGGQLGFFKNQITFKPQPLLSTTKLQNQVAIITGANIGIGLEAARQLATHAVSKLILGVRTVSKGDAAKTEILKSSPGVDVEVWPLDLESPGSIVAFAEKAKGLDRVDIAILNAGAKQLQFVASPSGHETNVQVNHLGTALLSLLLLPILRSTSEKFGQPARMTFTSSEVHFWTPFTEKSSPNILARMDEPSSLKEGMERYYTSKLLNVFWFRELSTKVKPENVIVNGANPGFCASQLHRHDGSAGFRVFLKLFAWSSEQGAFCIVDAAAGKGGESHGGYLQEQKVTPPSKFVLSKEGAEVQKKLWDETIELLSKECPKANLDEFKKA